MPKLRLGRKRAPKANVVNRRTIESFRAQVLKRRLRAVEGPGEQWEWEVRRLAGCSQFHREWFNRRAFSFVRMASGVDDHSTLCWRLKVLRTLVQPASENTNRACFRRGPGNQNGRSRGH